MQREHVRDAVFADDHERARFHYDCSSRAAEFGISAFFIIFALRRPANVTNCGTERDTDLAQGQDLGLPRIANGTDDAVRFRNAAELAQTLAPQAFQLQVRPKAITGDSLRQTRVASVRTVALKSDAMKELQLGTLRARICGGTDREGGGTGPLVLLMHGYGAPGTDLVPLWRELAVPPEVRFVFPEAPLELGFGGRAWWPIDMARLQERFTKSAAERLTAEIPTGVEEARSAVMEMLSVLEQDFAASPQSTVIGGFSQGAMLATDVVLRTTRPFAGLAIMSGSVISRAEWVRFMAARKGLPVLQGHGRADAVLPFAVAEQLRDLLTSAGLPVEFIPFNGGHGIPHAVLDGLSRLIQRVCAQKSA